MSLLRYPLVAALLGLFLGSLAFAPATDNTGDAAPASSESRDSKNTPPRDEAQPTSSPSDADACPPSAN